MALSAKTVAGYDCVGAAITASVALLLVIVPKLLVATQLNVVPESANCAFGNVYALFVASGIAVVTFLYHWYLGAKAPTPVATTVNVGELPTYTVTAGSGWRTQTGGAGRNDPNNSISAICIKAWR